MRRLSAANAALISLVDRSEHVEVEYAVIDGRLSERPVTMAEIPNWDPTGAGPFSVAAQVEFCPSVIADGGTLLGTWADGQLLGLAVVHASFERRLAWLAFLHVSRPHRRCGAATALWNQSRDLASTANAQSLYISATPTGSAVGFYLSRGCRLADPVHPKLFAQEPEDIHLIRTLA